MRVKRVNRYYCDFCKKSGCSAGHMKRHEKHCTMNPKRACGMCSFNDGGVSPPMSKLIKLLPDPESYRSEDEFGPSYSGALSTAANKALKGLRDEVEDCPACILAAIRQAGIPAPMVTDFNYGKECKSFWSEANTFGREQP